MMKWEAEQKGYTCNDCYLSMQNCHDKSICCEDETGLCDWFEELPSAQPYTAEEIDKMQELESAQLERVYELGRESGRPERKTGTWLIRKWGDDAECSNCTKKFTDVYDFDNYDRYCRNCGSKMERLQISKDLSEDSV